MDWSSTLSECSFAFILTQIVNLLLKAGKKKKRKKALADTKDLTEQQKVERRYADISTREKGGHNDVEGEKIAMYFFLCMF